MNAPTTTTRRSHGGDLTLTTIVPLGFDRRELRIDTSKNTYAKALETLAYCVQVDEDGRSFTHAFNLGGTGGDFRKVIALTPGARATEKNLQATHATGLQMLDDVLAAAINHYRKGSDE